MVRMESANNNPIEQRRKELRWRRNVKLWQASWRFLFFTGLTAGVFWGMKLPYWMVQNNEQITIEGNQLMKQDDILELISVNYPEYIWRLDIDNIIKQLESSQPILDAQVTRQILPVKVNVFIQERQPVALVLDSDLNKKTATPSKVLIGFLDKEGVFIPETFYRHAPNSSLPTITITGFLPEYKTYWVEIYNFMQNSSVKIWDIKWENPTSLMLKTSVGIFYLGNYPNQLQQQLQLIERMKVAPEQLDLNTIEYIDISNPQLPSVKLKPQESKK